MLKDTGNTLQIAYDAFDRMLEIRVNGTVIRQIRDCSESECLDFLRDLKKRVDAEKTANPASKMVMTTMVPLPDTAEKN